MNEGTGAFAPFFIAFRFPGVPKVRCAFSGRAPGPHPDGFRGGNVSYNVGDDPALVRAERAALMHALGVDNWHALRQVHGTDIHFEPAWSRHLEESVEQGDGLATSRPGQVLAVKSADCQPILLAHRHGTFVAALHAGWRGNLQEFPILGVQAVCERYGARPEDLFAVRGPSLGPAAAQFVNFELEWPERFAPWFDPATRTMDLWRLTRDQLAAAGVPRSQIFGLDLCTFSLPGFYSYRRDKKSGRQAGIIWIDKDDA